MHISVISCMISKLKQNYIEYNYVNLKNLFSDWISNVHDFTFAFSLVFAVFPITRMLSYNVVMSFKNF